MVKTIFSTLGKRSTIKLSFSLIALIFIASTILYNIFVKAESVAADESPQIIFRRYLSCDGCSDATVPSDTHIKMFIVFECSSNTEMLTLIDYFPSDWEVIDSNEGIVTNHNSTHKKILWLPFEFTGKFDVWYSLKSPTVIETTDYFFQSQFIIDKYELWGNDLYVYVIPEENKTEPININDKSFQTNYKIIQKNLLDGKKLLQKRAEINKKVHWVLYGKEPIPEGAENVLKHLYNASEVTEYDTPPPYKEENIIKPLVLGGRYMKSITIKSDFSGHYENVKSYTDIPEELAEEGYIIRLYHVTGNSKVDVTDNASYDVTFIDSDNNGLIDRIEWNVPQLSEQEFEVKASLTIIDVQSYPTVGGKWTVRFITKGTADLIITAVDGTTWSDTKEDNDLKFLEIKCGDTILDYEWVDDQLFIANYSCEDVGYETSKVLTQGKHRLEFKFGDQKAYANNFADPFETGIVETNGWTTVNMRRTYTTPIVVASPIEGYESSADLEVATAVVRNINSTNFEVQLYNESFGSLAGNVSYIVVENGSHVLSNGMLLQAGRYEPVDYYDADGDSPSSYYSITFWTPYASAPSVIASPNNDSAQDWVATRYDVGSLTTSGIDISLEIDQTYGSAPVATSGVGNGQTNSIGWIAMNRTSRTNMEAGLEVGVDEDPATGDWRTLSFSNSYTMPLFFGLGEEDTGTDPTTVGRQNLNETNVDIRRTEERTDNEQTHATEDTLWMVFESGLGNSPPTTPTNITCNGDSCNITVDKSVTVNASGSTDPDYNNITYFIEAALLNKTTSDDLETGEIRYRGESAASGSRYKVQPIPLTSFGGSTTLDVTIDSVDRNHSFIVKTQTSNSMGESGCDYAEESIISVRFTSDTNVRFERENSSCTPDVTGYIVEALDDQFTVYNCTMDFTGTGSTATCDITETVDTNWAMVIGSCNADGTNTDWFEADVRFEMLDSNTVQGTRAATGSTPTCHVFVVEWDNNFVGAVYHGVYTSNGVGPFYDSIGASVNTSSSLYFSTFDSNSNGLEQTSQANWLENATHVGSRQYDNGYENDISWYVIANVSGAYVQRNNWYDDSGSGYHTETISEVEWNRSYVFSTGTTYGDGTAGSRQRWANYNTSSTEVRWDMGNSHTTYGQRYEYWEVVQLPYYEGSSTNDTEATKDWTTYNDIVSSAWKNITEINVTVYVSGYDNSGSSNNKNNNPTLQLELATSGSGWGEVGNFSISGTGNVSLKTTDSTILNAWLTPAYRDLRIRGVDFDYNDSSNFDEINYTAVWAILDGRVWIEIGNNTNETVLDWNTTNITNQDCIDLRTRAIDINGTNSYSDYFTKGCCLNISHPDETPPEWYDNVTSVISGSEYYPNKQYQFNVTWNDSQSNVSIVLIEHNFTGSSNPHNDTLSTYDGDVYYFDVTDLPVGTYVWKEYANNTDDYWNVTNNGEYWIFKVEKNTSTYQMMNLTVGVGSGGAESNYQDTYPVTTNATGWYSSVFNGQDITFTLHRNDTIIGSSNPKSDVIELGVGFYMYIYNTSGNENFTATSKNFNLTIQQNQTNLVDLYFRNSTHELKNQNMTVFYETQVNATGTAIYSNSGTINLYRDGEDVTSENGEYITLGANTLGYEYKVNITGNKNYTSNSTGTKYYLFINKKQTETALWINDTRADHGFTQNDYANFTVELLNYPGKPVELWTNYSNGVWKLWDSGNSPLENITPLATTGQFEFLGNYSGDENYTYSEESWIVTVSVLSLDSKLESINPTTIDQKQNSTAVGNCSCTGGICNNVYIEIQADGEAIPTTYGNDLQVNGSNPYYLGSLNNDWESRSWNITGWGAGIYSITIKCNSTETGNTFSTSDTLTVNDITIPTWFGNTTSPTSGNEYIADRSYQFNVTWTDDEDIDTVLIEHNFTGSSNPHNDTLSTYDGDVYYFDVTDLPVGTYVWKEYANDTSDNWNVTDDENYWVYTVVKNTSTQDFMNLTINNTESNKQYSYESVSNATGWYFDNIFGGQDITFNLYRNDSLIGSSNPIEDAEVYGVGFYMYTYNTSGNENFTAASKQFNLTITKAVVSLVLENNVSWSATYPTATNTTASGCPSKITCNLYRNDTGEITNPDLILLGAGGYNYTYNTSGNENYTSDSVSNILTISKGAVQPSLSINTTWIETYPTPTNVSCSVNSYNGEVVCNLYRNDTGQVSNPNEVLLGVGAYNYTTNTSETANYTANSTGETKTLIMQINTSSDINLFLNGTQDNFEMEANGELNTTSVLVVPTSSDIEIWTNYSDGSWKLWDSCSACSSLENVTVLTESGIWNFTANFTNSNYSSAYDSWYVNFTRPVYGWLNVNLIEPDPSIYDSTSPFEAQRYDTFTIKANITCEYGQKCEEVNGTARRNFTSTAPENKIVGEYGEGSDLSTSWTWINFQHTFDDKPIIVALVEYNYNYDNNPCGVELKEANKTGFYIKSVSYDSGTFDNSCPSTGVDYNWLAMEKGVHNITNADGFSSTLVEAWNGTAAASDCGSSAGWVISGNNRQFQIQFSNPPVVIGSVQSANNDANYNWTYYVHGGSTSTKFSSTSMQMGLSVMEGSCSAITQDEEIGWIAWDIDTTTDDDPYTGTTGNSTHDYSWEAILVPDEVGGSDEDPYPSDVANTSYSKTYSEGVVVLAGGVRIDGTNGYFPIVGAEYNNLVTLLADEDQWGDEEQAHSAIEPFNILVFNGTNGFLYSNETAETMTEINTTIDGTPFYTTDNQPQTCGALDYGESCELIWSVNATGAINSVWEIDTIFSSNETSIFQNDTINAFINITGEIPPSFSNNAINSTFAGTAVNFTINVTDNLDLDNTAGYIFSTNNTGAWENSSFIYFNDVGKTLTAWNVTILNDTIGSLVQWKFYANDTSGNWNMSATYNLTTTKTTKEFNLTVYNSTAEISTALIRFYNSTNDLVASGIGELSFDFYFYENYTLEITQNVNGQNLTMNMANLNITDKFNITSQIVKNYTQSLPTGFNKIASVFAFNDTGMTYSYATIYIPNESFEITNITHCKDAWNFTDGSCESIGDWEVNDTADYKAQINSTHIFFNVTKFEGYGPVGKVYLEVNLTLPPGDTLVEQYKIFNVNATVYCRGGNCKNVYGTVRYNGSSSYPDTPINTTYGDEPFFVNETPPQALKACPNNFLTKDEFCNITWMINTTGDLDSAWKLGVLFNSSDKKVVDNNTDNVTLTIVPCIEELTVQFTGVEFGTVLPDTQGNSATENPNEFYNVSNSGTCTSNIWIKSTNMTKDSNFILYSNMSFNNVTNDYGSSYRFSNIFSHGNSSLKKDVAGSTNVTTYYFLDAPIIYAGDYEGNMTFCLNSSLVGTLC